MSAIWTPGADERGTSIVDTPVDAILRQRSTARLLALANRYDDQTYEVAAKLGMKRSRHAAYWAERTRELAAIVSVEPFQKALAPIEQRAA